MSEQCSCFIPAGYGDPNCPQHFPKKTSQSPAVSKPEPVPVTQEPPPEWMMLPHNEDYPNYKEFHIRNAWCEKAGCRPACNPETVCCAGGRFSEPHNCRKQDTKPAPEPAPPEQLTPERRANKLIPIVLLNGLYEVWFNQILIGRVVEKHIAEGMAEIARKGVAAAIREAIAHQQSSPVPPEQWMGDHANRIGNKFKVGAHERVEIWEMLAQCYAPVAAAHARELAKPRFNEQTHIARMVAAGCAIDFTDDLNLVVTNERAIAAEAERDRQYEFNIGQIAKLAAAEAALTAAKGRPFCEDCDHGVVNRLLCESCKGTGYLERRKPTRAECELTAAKARIEELEKELAQEYADDEVVTNHTNDILGKYEVDLVSARANSEAVRRLCEKIRSIASAAGHAPCRSGGIDAEGVCPNACFCEWAAEIGAALAEVEASGESKI